MYPRTWTLVGVALLAVCFSEPGIADDAASIVKEADTCVSQRNFVRAQTLYERAQAEGARFETDFPHASNLAAVYLNTTPPDLANAIKWLQVAVSLAPQLDSLRLQLANAFYRSGNLEAAIDQYKALAEAHPTSAEYAIQLATVLRQAGKSDVALQFLQAGTEKYPGLVALRIEYARQLNFAKQYPEARKQFSAALAVAPQNLIAQVGLAKATSYEGDQETAIEMYDRILQRHPGSYDALVGKAFSLLWSSRTGQASVLLRQALAKNPGDGEVREALSTLPHSEGVSKAIPENSIRPLEISRRLALRHPRNTEMPGSNPATSLDRTIPSRPEQPLSQQDQQHGNGVVVAIVGFCCLILAPMAYGRSRARRLKSPAGKTEDRCRRRTSDIPPSQVEQNSGNSSTVIEPVPELASTVGVVSEMPERDSIRTVSCTGEHSADSRQPAVEDSVAPPPVPVLAEEAASATAGQQVHERSYLSAPHPQDISCYQIIEAAETADDCAGSHEHPAAAEESEPKAKMKVLIVGGRLHEVQLQSQWFPIAATEILWERNWYAALRCLALAPPDLIVLNTLTDDGRTSQQMFDWILANRVEFCDRTIAIRSRADSSGREQERSCAYLVEPYGAPQWRQAVLSTVHSGEVSLHRDEPAKPLVRTQGDKFEPQERTYSELRTLLCSATSYGPLVEANPGPPAGS
jgi:tetratricopeptide (TPR) repeat protein